MKDNIESSKMINDDVWSSVTEIYGRVLSLIDDIVECECLVDKENKIFQNRTFPKILFDNVDNLCENSYVIICIKMRKGAMRFDVYDGKNIIDETLFEIDWCNLSFGI